MKTWVGTLDMLTGKYPRHAKVLVHAGTPASAARQAVTAGIKEIRFYAGRPIRCTGLVLRLEAFKKASPDDPGTVL